MLNSFYYELSNNAVKAFINRPKQLNAINLDVAHNIIESVRTWNQDAKIVILQGVGKAFSAGGDIKSIYLAKKEVTPETQNSQNYIIRLGDMVRQCVHQINTMNPLLITILDGYVMGIGSGLGVLAPIRIATENSKFAMPEAKVGLVPDAGAGIFMTRMPHNIGLLLGMTGQIINGYDMCHLGLADHYVESIKLPKLIEEIEHARVEDIRDLVKSFASPLREFSLQSEIGHIEQIFKSQQLNEICYAVDHSHFKQPIRQNCPTSIALYYELLMRNRPIQTLKQNLIFEQRVYDRIAYSDNYTEGLKALFEDRTYKAKWSPSRIEEVEDIQSYFKPIDQIRENIFLKPQMIE